MSEVNLALQEVSKYLAPAVGFSDYESPKEDSKIIIRQNNTIIHLLLQVLAKLNNNQSNKEIVLASSGVISSSNNINSEKWTYLKATFEETKPSGS